MDFRYPAFTHQAAMIRTVKAKAETPRLSWANCPIFRRREQPLTVFTCLLLGDYPRDFEE